MGPDLEEYRVQLDCYSGPLDLLLFLVRRHEIDLHDIPIAQLTEQYLRHLELIKQIDVDLTGQFLVMAATLLEIKSAMLLPRPDAIEQEDGGAAEVLDPRYELVQQLLAYKRFKDASMALDGRRRDWEARFPAQAGHLGFDGQTDTVGEAAALPAEIDLEDVHLLDLCEAFAKILESISAHAPHEVTYDDTPVALHADDIVDRLGRDGPMTLQAIFVGRTSRSEMIGLFLAMLELVRLKKIHVLQDDAEAPIRLELRSGLDQSVIEGPPRHDWRDPETGEVQYEWPSEAARLRAERRAQRTHGRPFAERDEPAIELDNAEPKPA
jgi:segregation and condensation protein A